MLASIASVDKSSKERHLAGMSQILEMTPCWDAVGWVVKQNTHDVIDRRYGLLPEVVSWFKSLAMFRDAERDLMILKEPTSHDRDFHKTVLALLIAQGERLRVQLAAAGGMGENESGITVADFESALEHLYDTQSDWHGEMTPDRKAEILKGVLHGKSAGA
jgi:hypothetical protein